MRRAVFFDRDGIINKDYGYVYRYEDIEYCEGIFEICQDLVSRGFLLFIVTNQSGIGRNFFSEANFLLLMTKIFDDFRSRSISFADLRFCPHLPDDNCLCRKPLPTMVLDLVRRHDIDLSASAFIGDRCTDLLCGDAAGLGFNFFVGNESLNCELPRVVHSFSDLDRLRRSVVWSEFLVA